MLSAPWKSPWTVPRKPRLEPGVEQELEAIGVAELRRVLAATYRPEEGSLDAFLEGVGPPMIKLPDSIVQRSDLTTWLSWRTAQDKRRETIRFWLLAGLAGAAAVISAGAWVFPRSPGRVILPSGAVYSEGKKLADIDPRAVSYVGNVAVFRFYGHVSIHLDEVLEYRDFRCVVDLIAPLPTPIYGPGDDVSCRFISG